MSVAPISSAYAINCAVIDLYSSPGNSVRTCSYGNRTLAGTSSKLFCMRIGVRQLFRNPK